MGWLRTFFKGEGVHVHVWREEGGPQARTRVKLSGTLARSVRPRLVSFLETLELENATFYVSGDATSGWTIKRSTGLDDATEQRIRNFLANEV